MSAFGGKADIAFDGCNVCFWPKVQVALVICAYYFSSRNGMMTAIACWGCSSMIQCPELLMTALRTLEAAKPISVAR